MEPSLAGRSEVWANAMAYESYVGRWSRHVARGFLDWLAAPPQGRWLDVGCGTGALVQSIIDTASPNEVIGMDRSGAYAAFAQHHVHNGPAHFVVGDAQALPFGEALFDRVVSGLMLNFVPDVARAVAEMARVVRHGGAVALYVWDYAGAMQFMRYFWDAAVTLDHSSRDLDEGTRFTICNPEALTKLFRATGLRRIEVRAIDIATVFRDFEDYWSPFLGGQGSAPGYVASLTDAQRTTLRERLRSSLPFAPDGSIHLLARAWAVRGARPGSN